jgi:hypothetical protein
MYAGTLEECVASPSNWKFRNLSFPLLLAFTLLALRKEVQHARQAETTLVYTQRKLLYPNNEKRFLIEFILSLPLFMFRIRTNNHNFSSSPY